MTMAAIRRCISSPAARPGRSDKTLLLDSAFGVSMIDQFCSSADFGLGMLGLDSGIPGTNDQGRGDPRYAGMPEFRTGFQALGNSPTWTPTYRDEGTTSFSTNVTKVKSNHDFRVGYRRRLPAPRQLAAGTGEPARTVRLRQQRHEDVRHRLADRELLQPVRGVPARPRGHRAQELSVRAVHRPRVAACDVLPRSLDGEPEAHARSRRALGVLPDHDAAPIGRSR